jgi:ABC-type phosphate/phosphonate transport system substrate-binding protein
MSEFIAALPMYDWPETRTEVDAEWSAVRDRLRAAGIDAPERLTRRNADLPPVPGGIRDASGRLVASDPATLPPDELDLHALWRHPSLLFSQTCWGPLESSDLANHVRVVGQPDYSAFEGGAGQFYASVIVMREADLPQGRSEAVPPATERGNLPLQRLRGTRLAFNALDSMSGLLALRRDLEAAGESLAIFSATLETGSHRASAMAVAEGRADVAAIDCRTWSLFKRFRPEAEGLAVVGWTAKRKGLPFVRARALPVATARVVDRLFSPNQAPSTTSKPSKTG